MERRQHFTFGVIVGSAKLTLRLQRTLAIEGFASFQQTYLLINCITTKFTQIFDIFL